MTRVSMSGSQEKPFDIPKSLVWEAYKRVKANKGAAGVDRCSMEEFEKDLKRNLYKIWNRMSSGAYFPPAVKAVEIPKPGGTRMLGVPTDVANHPFVQAAFGLAAGDVSVPPAGWVVSGDFVLEAAWRWSG